MTDKTSTQSETLLREALEPFAKAADDYGITDETDEHFASAWEHPISMSIRVVDFVNARAALQSIPEPRKVEETSMSDYVHASDCSLHNEPASPAGPCDCMGLQDLAHALGAVLWMAEEWFEHNGSGQVCAEGHRGAIGYARSMHDAALSIPRLEAGGVTEAMIERAKVAFNQGEGLSLEYRLGNVLLAMRPISQEAGHAE